GHRTEQTEAECGHGAAHTECGQPRGAGGAVQRTHLGWTVDHVHGVMCNTCSAEGDNTSRAPADVGPLSVGGGGAAAGGGRRGRGMKTGPTVVILGVPCSHGGGTYGAERFRLRTLIRGKRVGAGRRPP